MPTFIVITGPDGSGKSTLCKRLTAEWHKRYGTNYCNEIAIWDFFLHKNAPYQSKQELMNDLPKLDDMSRMRLIMSLLKMAFDVRLEENRHVYVVNGFWYKYAASELAYGVRLGAIQSEVKDFPVPDFVFLLDVPTKITALRKNNESSPYERGAIRSGIGDFVQFQTKMGQAFKRINEKCGPWKILSGLKSKDVLMRQVLRESQNVIQKNPLRPDLAHGVVLNTQSNAGLGKQKWDRVIKSHVAKDLGLGDAPILECHNARGQEGCKEQVVTWIESLARAGARNFVAAGGDGTVNMVLNALMYLKTVDENFAGLKLGSVALGSSNDFHKPHNLPHRFTISGCPSRLKFTDAVATDVGILTLGQAHQFFIVNASIGATAEAARSLNQDKKLIGFLKQRSMDLAAILVGAATILRYNSLGMVINSDGIKLGPKKVYNCGIVKVPFFAGQMRYDSPFEPFNGKFYVHLVSEINRLEALKLMVALLNGKFSGLPQTESFTATNVRVRADHKFSLEYDGEIVECDEASFSVIPQALLVCP